MIKNYCYCFKFYLFDWGIIAVFVQNIILDEENNRDDKKKAYINICILFYLKNNLVYFQFKCFILFLLGY